MKNSARTRFFYYLKLAKTINLVYKTNLNQVFSRRWSDDARRRSYLKVENFGNKAALAVI